MAFFAFSLSLSLPLALPFFISIYLSCSLKKPCKMTKKTCFFRIKFSMYQKVTCVMVKNGRLPSRGKRACIFVRWWSTVNKKFITYEENITLTVQQSRKKKRITHSLKLNHFLKYRLITVRINRSACKYCFCLWKVFHSKGFQFNLCFIYFFQLYAYRVLLHLYGNQYLISIQKKTLMFLLIWKNFF